MKVIKNIETENYKELVLEYCFLWLKFRLTYRMFDGQIFKYNPKKDTYLNLGYFYYIDIRDYFKIKV